LKFANKVLKPFDYTPASVTMADPNYLRKKFAAIRKQQEEAKKQAEVQQLAKVRKIK
jgi:hypothetical protein